MNPEILTKQEAFKTKHGRYFQVRKGLKKNPREKETIDMKNIPNEVDIHEHLCPNGEVGFTVYEYKIEDRKEMVKGNGRGCGSFTFDWTVIEKEIIWQ